MATICSQCVGHAIAQDGLLYQRQSYCFIGMESTITAYLNMDRYQIGQSAKSAFSRVIKIHLAMRLHFSLLFIK